MNIKLLVHITRLIVIWMACVTGPMVTAEPINLNQPESIKKHRPVLIAHRGGIITPQSPECSLTAIRLAAASHYDMIEVDIQVSRDGIPMVFHDRTLNKACGKDGRIEDYSASELESINYLNGTDTIVRLDKTLKVCRELEQGVMLDLKTGRDSEPLMKKINRLIKKHQLEDSIISITGSEMARQHLTHVRFTPTNEEMARLRKGVKLDLRHRFWFGLPQQLQDKDIERLKAAGALIIPAINTFRYPAKKHLELAEKDIKRLSKQGVDGFQIDSIYDRFFQK